jgi:hypothetical protein
MKKKINIFLFAMSALWVFGCNTKITYHARNQQSMRNTNLTLFKINRFTYSSEWDMHAIESNGKYKRLHDTLVLSSAYKFENCFTLEKSDVTALNESTCIAVKVGEEAIIFISATFYKNGIAYPQMANMQGLCCTANKNIDSILIFKTALFEGANMLLYPDMDNNFYSYNMKPECVGKWIIDQEQFIISKDSLIHLPSNSYFLHDFTKKANK